MENSRDKKSGFTLSEVLITLVIIGIIAALTIPSVVQKTQEQQTVVALKKTYSVLGQAFQMATAEYGTPDNWGLGTGNTAEGAISISDIFVKYLNVAKYCGTEQGCFPESYSFLNGGLWDLNQSTTQSKIILNDGTLLSFGIDAKGGENCSSNGNGRGNVCGKIGVDINGFTSPNKTGRDFFWFYVTKEGIVPIGTASDISYPISTCNMNSSGAGCAAWVLYRGNIDYLRKTVSW